MFFKNSLLLISLFFISPAYSNSDFMQRKFEARLGATRVIYNLDDHGELLRIQNPQEYPILIQSKILNSEGVEDDNFIVAPPIFRLDEQRETDIKIIRTGGEFPEKRESLKSLCVKGVPPKEDDLWASDNKNKAEMKINVSINTCIKLIIRPKSVERLDINADGLLNWYVLKNNVFVKNKSPYYLTIVNIKANDKSIKNTAVIPPYEEVNIAHINDKKQIKYIRWSLIGDFGEISKEKYNEV
ncbi:fimbria/pilus periplasmic chaperone [Escherichia coli]